MRRPELPPGPYLVVGLARSGVAAALALRARGERVVGVDAGAPEGLDALREAGVELCLDSDGCSLLERVSTVVKSPGVPAEAPVVAAARAGGICVVGELELAWRMLPNELIAVTATNGKTTTVQLIGHIHRAAGLPVAVAGNVGAALSGLVGRAPEQVTIVCEASSFQLEDTLAFAPEAAVLLNVSPDHLDRHGTMEAYRAAKLRIFAHQSARDVAVVPVGFEPAGLPGAARRVSFGRESGGLPGAPRRVGAGGGSNARGDGAEAQLWERDGVLHWEGQPLLEAAELSLRGVHNLHNAMAAAAVCLARGIDVEAVRAGLRTFPGVPHRLQEIARIDGVLYVNDSKATNVASTLVALDAMAGEGLPVHLIAGGQDKGQDFAGLRPAVERTCRAVYLIGRDAERIERALAGAPTPVHRCATLERAVERARAAARPGEVVLLSPGCASYDQFSDFEARGERFAALVGRFASPR